MKGGGGMVGGLARPSLTLLPLCLVLAVSISDAPRPSPPGDDCCLLIDYVVCLHSVLFLFLIFFFFGVLLFLTGSESEGMDDVSVR